MTTSSRATVDAFEFPYITCRNISGPEDDAAGRKVYSGHAPASSVLSLEDDDNVREYLADAHGEQKNMPTLVHQAIRKTLEDQPDQFSILNGGMVIVARAVEVDDKRRAASRLRSGFLPNAPCGAQRTCRKSTCLSSAGGRAPA